MGILLELTKGGSFTEIKLESNDIAAIEKALSSPNSSEVIVKIEQHQVVVLQVKKKRVK